ncbi:OsmC family protein [Microlunatus panaciterrae]|uniref:OsmC-like protein n=1 Tax=Microlunatus panaciterrae TaxID=400768 RepID=A0ABS2RK19_9ACTN|nr:OsmC family protein [Microlunatus panaciterrae]MBM7798912.1 putative OsmC-like protein [Microlunatus panaciterrae]
MNPESLRRLDLTRLRRGHYLATNVRGGTLSIGSGDDAEFTPVELLLAAIAACSAIDVDFITSKRAEPERFEVRSTGHKIRDERGNRMVELAMDFDVLFGDDEDGRRAEEVLVRSVRQSHDRLCTVTRTLEMGEPVSVSVRGEPLESA